MTEYCSLSFTWEPDKDPKRVVEYKFSSDGSDQPEHGRQHSRDHFFILGQVGGERLQVTHYPSDAVDGHEGAENNSHCTLSLECKPVYSVHVKGFAIASEARTLEVYDGRNDSYLQTVRGMRDVEDSEADDSKIHFMCRCTLEEPLKNIKIKFLSLGPRQNFEIAHIRLMMETCSQNTDGHKPAGQGIDMDKLRRDVDSMGDTVSDRARAFLTTLENFQKGRQGAVDDVRQLLMDKNATGSDASSLAGITTLLSMFSSVNSASGQSQQAEGSVMNQMLSQMMSSLLKGQGVAGQDQDRGDMYNFLQSVCSQVSDQRAEADRLEARTKEEAAAKETEEKSKVTETAELESKLESKLDSIVESRLDAVEERLMTRVDEHLAELETRMSSKLDAVLALLQNASTSK